MVNIYLSWLRGGYFRILVRLVVMIGVDFTYVIRHYAFHFGHGIDDGSLLISSSLRMQLCWTGEDAFLVNQKNLQYLWLLRPVFG